MRTFLAYGTTFQLRSNDSACLDEAVQRARTLRWRDRNGTDAEVCYALTRAQNPDGARSRYELRCGGEVIRVSTDWPTIIEAFEDHAKLETAYRARGCVFVHAGAVAWRGCGIVLPGRSRAGKTMLVRALLDLGADYYSDEFAVVDAHGRLQPYPVPLSMRRPGAARRDRVGGGGRDWSLGVVPVPIRLIAVTGYRPGARWRPRPLSPAHGLLALMNNAVAATRPPHYTMPILREAMSVARAIESKRGNAIRIARELLSAVSSA